MLALSAFAALAVPACDSSSPARSPKSALLGSSRQQGCTAIADVLSDGPDPSADPVGYAQAQVLPLGRLTVAEAPLRRAVQALAAAYEAASRGGAAGSAAAHHVSVTEAAVNKLCPQAAP